jgi:hypothetical protein
MIDASPLLSSVAVRDAGRRMLEDGLSAKLDHWSVDLDRLPEVARLVAAETRAAYPSLNVPLHSRWRHFEAGGIARWQNAAAQHQWRDKAQRARAAFDLAIVSVLLDAGSGGRWQFTEPETGLTFASSEGLGVASFHLIANGAFSKDPADPWRVDAERLVRCTEDDLVKAFQVSGENPLAGVGGRVALLKSLGEACLANATVFARIDDPRPGGLADTLSSSGNRIEAPAILRSLLENLGSIWPSRLKIGAQPMGDTWLYERWRSAGGPLAAYVPFHKLSQWLTYSLIEPLLGLGIDVTAIDGLTGLAEYRNGGLFIDMDVLSLQDEAQTQVMHQVSSPLIVEWRALTVALLDRLLPLVRQELAVSAERFSIAAMLEGGSWAAGRRMAREKRADGAPPLKIASDGTTF